MRSVIGPLLLGLIPLVGAGCALPNRSASRPDQLAVRAKGLTETKTAASSRNSSEIDFRRPKTTARLSDAADHEPFPDEATPSDAVGTSTLTDDSGEADWDAETTSVERTSTFTEAPVSRTMDSNSRDLESGRAALYTDTDETFVSERVAVAKRELPDPDSDEASAIGQVQFQFEDGDAENNVETLELKQEPTALLDGDRSEDEFPDDVQPARPLKKVASTQPSGRARIATDIPLWADRHLEQNGSSSGISSNSRPRQETEAIGQGEAELAKVPNGPMMAGSLSPLPWQADLEQLITRVERDLAASKGDLTGERLNEHIRKHAHLRLLYLMAQRQEQALTAIPGVDPAQQEYWQQLIWAMSNNFDTVQFPDPSQRAAQTVPPLSGALRQMREQAALTIKNMTFCRKISYFGNYERFPRNEFTPGHEVLLYTEIENFVSAPTTDGEYRTSLKSLIEITNSEGKIVWTKGFPSTEDFCRNPRRDYFHNYQFYLPEDLSTGAYSLKLTIVDELSNKRVSNSLNFVLK